MEKSIEVFIKLARRLQNSQQDHLEQYFSMDFEYFLIEDKEDAINKMRRAIDDYGEEFAYLYIAMLWMLRLPKETIETISNIETVALDQQIYHYEGDYFQQQCEDRQQEALVYNDHGNAKYSSKDYAGAIGEYSKAIELNPKDAQLHCNRGNAKYRLKDYQGAIVDLNKSIELNSNNWANYNLRGNAKYGTTDYSGAVADYSKAIELNPKDAQLHCNRAGSKNLLKDYTGAIADYSKAIELDPSNSSAYCARGEAKIEIGQKENGCLDLHRAGDLGSARALELIKKFCQ